MSAKYLKLGIMITLFLLMIGHVPPTLHAEDRQQPATLIFSAHHADVEGAIMSADENRVLSWSGIEGTARIWDVDSGDALITVEHAAIWHSRWNTDESKFMTWGWDIYLKVLDTATGAELLALEHDNKIAGAKWNADETRILSWSHRGTVYIWDTSTSQTILQIPHDGFVEGAIWNHNETQIMTWILWHDNSGVYVWDAETGERLHLLPHESAISATWSADERRILTCGWDDIARIWNAETGDLLFEIEQLGLNGAQWNANETQILTWAENSASIWDASTDELIVDMNYDSHDGHVGARWSPAERQVVIWADLLDTLSVWDTVTGDAVLTLTMGNAQTTDDYYVWSAQWNREGSRILGYSFSDAAIIWDARDGSIIATLEHNDLLDGAVWSNSETRILTWSRRD